MFTAEDFRDVGALYVEDLMYLSARCNEYAQQLWDAEQQLVMSIGIVTEEELHEIRDELLGAYEVAGSHAVRSFVAESGNQEVLQAYMEALERAEKYTMWNFDQFRRILLIRLEQNCRENVLHAVYLLQQREYIKSVEPNLIPVPDSILEPNDHYFRETGDYYQWAVRRLSLPQAWGSIPSYPSNTRVVRVGILGHGIYANHPELIGRVTAGGYGSLSSTGDNSYGTRQAGIIGAMGNNNIGIAGISWNVEMVSLGAGVGNQTRGINWATQNGIPILTRSFGGAYRVGAPLYHAVQSYGGLFINSAGNDNENTDNNPRFPGLSNVLVVGASNMNDERSVWNEAGTSASNYGRNSVHLFAPGGGFVNGVRRRIRTTDDPAITNQLYGFYGGTSAAAPHVAGVAALVLSVNPDLSTQQLRDIILSSVCPIPAFANISISGGRLNAYRAVSYAKQAAWASLQNAINAAPAGELVTIRIYNSIMAPTGAGGNAIVIPANRNIWLVGVGSRRALTQTNANQRHFVVSQGGSLMLGNNITLSGGAANNTNNSGGILVDSGGLLTMLEGCIIENNHRTIAAGAIQLQGTGTAIDTRARFYLRGGQIRNNTGTCAGGINVTTNSAFTMSGGTISSNTANGWARSGGGVRLADATSTFNMTWGTISGNRQASTFNPNEWGAGGVAIVGNGAFTMSGGNITGNSSMFSQGAGAVSMTAGTFTMSGTARIAGNTASGGHSAGGVHVDGSTAQFIMNGGTIGGNTVADANEGRSAGGVRQARGRTTMNGGLIQGNTNGGVRIQELAPSIAEFTMNGGTIEGNVSTGAIGAGVHLASGAFTMVGGTIRSNQQNGGTTANSGGGGVRVDSGTFTMNGVSARIESNTASGTAATAGGGGVRHQGGTAIITAGTITNNHANSRGGGVFSNSPTNLTIGSGAVIVNNTPDNITQQIPVVNTWAGLRNAINYAVENVPSTIQLSASFTVPTGTDGNAIVIPANHNITLVSNGTTVRTLTQTNANQRHFVVSQGASLTLGNRITLSGGAANNTNNSGGILVDAGGSLTMLAGSIVENNHRTIAAGAVQLQGTGTSVGTRATFDMRGGTIRNNTGTHAGGINVTINSTFTMSGGTISGSTANGFGLSGGGVRLTDATSTFTMTGGTISGNRQTTIMVQDWGAGGVAISNGAFTMSGGNIVGNSSTCTWGAGAVILAGGAFTMSGTARISGNTATGSISAGGVHVSGINAQFIMNGGTIGGNTAADANDGLAGGLLQGRGRTSMNGGTIQGNTNGGVRVQILGVNSEFTMNGGTIDRNVSTGTIGAGVHVVSGVFTMVGGTIQNNQQNGGTTANSGGGGVRVDGGTFTMNGASARIENNTASGTAATAGGGGVRHQGGTAIITAGIITNNHANTRGGGVFSNSPANLTIGSSAVITNNSPDNTHTNTNTNMLASELDMYYFKGYLNYLTQYGYLHEFGIQYDYFEHCVPETFDMPEVNVFDAISVLDVSEYDEYLAPDDYHEIHVPETFDMP